MQGNLKKAYAAEAQVKCLANTADLLMAYLDGILQSAPLPEPVASELRLVLNRLLQISGFQGQALGLAVARRQLWLFKARVPDEDKSVLLDTPITPGHTFGSAVEEMLQRSHREHKVSQEIASMHPSHTLGSIVPLVLCQKLLGYDGLGFIIPTARVTPYVPASSMAKCFRLHPKPDRHR
ncbi:UNVERIFIED_CONTAM: hypothetical protein FKN15_049099 [Acipenser sinensis]